MNPKRNRARDVGFYILLLLILVAVIFTMSKDTELDQVENYSDLVDLFTQEKVQSFTTEGNKIILEVRTDDAENPTEEMTYDSLLQEVDKRLYTAKKSGKNRVIS